MKISTGLISMCIAMMFVILLDNKIKAEDRSPDASDSATDSKAIEENMLLNFLREKQMQRHKHIAKRQYYKPPIDDSFLIDGSDKPIIAMKRQRHIIKERPPVNNEELFDDDYETEKRKHVSASDVASSLIKVFDKIKDSLKRLIENENEIIF